MQQKNVMKTTNRLAEGHRVNHTQPASPWVLDSKPLTPGKHNVTLAQAGCGGCACAGGCGGAPAAQHKN